jgi:hypothetical protein
MFPLSALAAAASIFWAASILFDLIVAAGTLIVAIHGGFNFPFVVPTYCP